MEEDVPYLPSLADRGGITAQETWVALGVPEKCVIVPLTLGFRT